MYKIDLNTCTALDVIKRSNVCHPSLLADGLREAMATHRSYSVMTTNENVARIAGEMADECAAIIAHLEDDNYSAIVENTGRKVIAFGVAASLQLIPRSMRGEIVER